MTIPNLATVLAFDAGRADAFLEAARMLDLPAQTLRLHAGEMTAQEMRTVQAVLKWLAQAIAAKGAPLGARSPN